MTNAVNVHAVLDAISGNEKKPEEVSGLTSSEKIRLLNAVQPASFRKSIELFKNVPQKAFNGKELDYEAIQYCLLFNLIGWSKFVELLAESMGEKDLNAPGTDLQKVLNSLKVRSNFTTDLLQRLF